MPRRWPFQHPRGGYVFPPPQDTLYAFLPASHPLIAGDPENQPSEEEIAFEREANAPGPFDFFDIGSDEDAA